MGQKPGTIIDGVISTWIIGDGSGPGHPSLGFYADNGGEFLNEEFIDFAAAMDVQIKMTAAEAPWQNCIEKLLLENPSMDI